MLKAHEWKADSLTPGDLVISRQCYERVAKRQLKLVIKNSGGIIRSQQKSAEVIVVRQRALRKKNKEVSPKDEGRNVRTVK